MVSEVYAGISSLKIAFDLAKGLKEIDDATRRNAAVIELQEKILSAQEAQAQLVERVRSLETEITNFQKWESEKEKYELQCVGWGVYAHVLKPKAREGAPPHRVCPNCFENKNISIIQHRDRGPDIGHFCPSCKTKFSIRISTLSWDEYKNQPV